MRNLNEIETEFKAILDNQSLTSSEKNQSLVKLMNELEREHNTLIINPNKQELEKAEIKLYQAISLARD